MQKIIQPSYKLVELEINKETINDFFILEDERRKIRVSQVSSITASLLRGQHFNSLLAVNFKEEKYRVIDGNHRIEALKEILRKNNSFKINVVMQVYYDLSRDEERESYTILNKGVAESSNDYLKNYFFTIPLHQEILRILPVSIYGSEKTITINKFIGSYFDIKKENVFRGTGMRKETFLKDLKELNLYDLKILNKFYQEYSSIFGVCNKSNVFYDSTPFSALQRIWFDNQHIPRLQLLRIWKKIIFDKLLEWTPMMKSGGRQGAIFFYNQILGALNNSSKFEWISYKKKLEDEKNG